MRILCAGIMVMDLLAAPVTADGLKRDSSQLKAFEIQPGGDALNTAMELSALGADVRLAACLGDDAFGRLLLDVTTKAGIKTDGIIIRDTCTTACTLVAIDEHAERHFFSYGDSFRCFAEEDICDAHIRESDLLHIGSAMILDALDGEGLARLMERAHRLGAKTSMDITILPERGGIEKIRQALYHTNYFLPSLYECELLCGSTDIEAIKAFFAEFGLETLVIKMGERGCFATDFRQDVYLPASVPAELVKDTTGAGDSFVAGFLYGIMKGMKLEQALRFGTAMSAACIQTIGATKGVIENRISLSKLAGNILRENGTLIME